MQSRRSSYSYILRAIGQSLEEKWIVDFDLVVTDRNYEVRWRRRARPPQFKVRQWWLGFWSLQPDAGPSLLYTPVDIEWVELTRLRGFATRKKVLAGSSSWNTMGWVIGKDRIQL
jgi:hypothetical protein